MLAARADVARARHLASIVGNFSPTSSYTNTSRPRHKTSTVRRTDTTTVSTDSYASGLEVNSVDRHVNVDKEDRFGRVKRKERYSEKTNESTSGSFLGNNRRKSTYKEEEHEIKQFDDDLGLESVHKAVSTTSHTTSPDGRTTETITRTQYTTSKPDLLPYTSTLKHERGILRDSSYGAPPVDLTADEDVRRTIHNYHNTTMSGAARGGTYSSSAREATSSQTVLESPLDGTVRTESNHMVHEDSFHSIPDSTRHVTKTETHSTQRNTGLGGTIDQMQRSTTVKDRTQHANVDGSNYTDVKQSTNTKVSFSNTNTTLGLDDISTGFLNKTLDGKLLVTSYDAAVQYQALIKLKMN